jgi:hypothetical protein
MCNLCAWFFRKKRIIEPYIVKNELIHMNKEECCICLEELNREPCVVTNHCNHFFHEKCYKEYKNSKIVQTAGILHCPYCNTFQQKI